MDVEENRGIKLRSGKIVTLRKSYFDYSDSDSDDNSYSYLCDPSDSDSDDSFCSYSYGSPVLKPDMDEFWEIFGEEIGPQFDYDYCDFVEESIEKKIMSKIGVPSGYGEVAGKYLEELNGCYQNCRISHDQLHEMVKGFAKYLSWFPEDVSENKIEKWCREAYVHVLWKSFIDDKISRRQFVDLMKRYKKFGKKPNKL